MGEFSNFLIYVLNILCEVSVFRKRVTLATNSSSLEIVLVVVVVVVVIVTHFNFLCFLGFCQGCCFGSCSDYCLG